MGRRALVRGGLRDELRSAGQPGQATLRPSRRCSNTTRRKTASPTARPSRRGSRLRGRIDQGPEQQGQRLGAQGRQRQDPPPSSPGHDEETSTSVVLQGRRRGLPRIRERPRPPSQPDQFRWLNSAGMKWGVDESRPGPHQAHGRPSRPRKSARKSSKRLATKDYARLQAADDHRGPR